MPVKERILKNTSSSIFVHIWHLFLKWKRFMAAYLAIKRLRLWRKLEHKKIRYCKFLYYFSSPYSIHLYVWILQVRLSLILIKKL